jgi:hypothetical protein
MPTLVKQHLDSKPAPETTGNGLTVAMLLIAIAVAGALLSTIFPLPPDEVPVVRMVWTPDVNFFAP